MDILIEFKDVQRSNRASMRLHTNITSYEAQIRALNNFNGSEEKLVTKVLSGGDQLMNSSPPEDLCKGHYLLLA